MITRSLTRNAATLRRINFNIRYSLAFQALQYFINYSDEMRLLFLEIFFNKFATSAPRVIKT